MPTVSVFTFDKIPPIDEVCRSLDGRKFQESWINAKPSKYNRDEAFIQFWYYEDVEENMRRVLTEEDFYEIVSFLKENGKSKVLKRTYCFINTRTKTFEIYRGQDEKTFAMVSLFENLLDVKFSPLKLSSQNLQKIYSDNSFELKQVMFKNVQGLIYDVFRGNYLEDNSKFKEYLKSFPECLRVISFRPKIRFLNSCNKYQVTINGDKGTIRLSEGMFSWRPRFEIRQIVFIIAATVGLLAS